MIKTSAIDSFPQVKDINLESKEPVEEKEENFTEDEVLTGYVVTGLLAGLAIGGVLLAPVTGGASLGITFSAGTAAFGSGLNTYEMKKNSSEIEEDPAADALLAGSTTTSVLAGIAIVGVLMAPVTGGASLGLTVISGTAAAGTGLTTSGMVRNSRETGYQPDSTEIAENLIMGGCVGAMTGAFILDIIASVPACAVAAGVTVSMSLGTSALTTSIIPPIVETASYGVAVLSGVFTANEIYSRNAGHNELLEKVFKNNTSAYEGFGEILALISMGIITTGTANSGLVSKKGVYYENNESVEDFIKNNVHPGFQQNVKEAFMSDARVTTLKQNTTVYRYHGGGSSGNSYWYTPNQTANPGGDLALPPGNTYQYMDTYIVPEGTTILEGTVAPNFGQPGGGYQFYVPDPSVVKKQ